MILIQSINGQSLPVQPKSPDGYKVTLFDLDSDGSERSTENGEMIRHVIRQNVYKLELAFRCKASELRVIRTLVSPTELTVVFWDIDRYVSAKMYRADFPQQPLPTTNGDGWYDFSFSLTEY